MSGGTVSLTDMEQQVVWIIAVFGALTMIGVFWRMKTGFGPTNMRIVGIVLIATFASLLGVNADSFSSAIGILGAIAGYLFGLKDQSPQP
jgi:hypothetical protein